MISFNEKGWQNLPSSNLFLIIKANRLQNRDIFSKSDPVCIAFQYIGRLTGKADWVEHGRTEILKDSLNPEWATPININYFFEERQTLKFEIYDIDSESEKLSSHDFLGRIQCDLAEIVSVGTFTKNLTGLKGESGIISITCEEINNGSKESIQFSLKATKLDKKDFLGKSDPFLNVYKINDDGSRQLTYRTEVIHHNINPQWKMFEVNQKLLCVDKDKPIFIECWDYDRSGGHDFIGSCETTVNKLVSKDITSLPLINVKKKLKKGKRYKNSGVLHFNSTQIMKEYSFYDFIAGGTQLDFTVAVDFTASNGAVHYPKSLHYISSNQPNQYELAIRVVVEICQHYSSSKIFSGLGFGAIIPPENFVSPVFNLNFERDSSVVGLSGILAAYRRSLDRVVLYGPTNFAPVIKEAAKKAARISRDGSRYHLLLIITDGAISDMAPTKSEIISASSLPLSIIIIGVGNDDFENMKELDADGRLLTYGGRTAQRDIVQFVPMRNYIRSPYDAQNEHIQYMISKEVLAEVPYQMTSYMKRFGIVPGPARDQWPKASTAVNWLPEMCPTSSNSTSNNPPSKLQHSAFNTDSCYPLTTTEDILHTIQHQHDKANPSAPPFDQQSPPDSNIHEISTSLSHNISYLNI